MNSIDTAIHLITRPRRHKAALKPRTLKFAYHWMRGSTRVPYAPIKMHVEPTSWCNLRCIMCPQSIGSNKTNGYMDLDLYKEIVDQAKGHVYEFNLFFRGEPLLHRKLPEMVELAKGAGIITHVNTNATILREGEGNALIDAGLDKLTISFDGGSKAIYERFRVGAKYERTLDNVMNFLHLKLRRGVKHPYVVMQVIQEFDRTRPPWVPQEFLDLFKGLPVDEWDPIYPHGWAGLLQDSDKFKAKPYGHEYHPCNWLWKSMAVYWNGDVPACCADFAEDYILGNVRQTPLLELWNGVRMQALRRLQVEGRAQEVEPCRGCDALWHSGGVKWHIFHGVEKLIQLSARPEPAPPAPPQPAPSA